MYTKVQNGGRDIIDSLKNYIRHTAINFSDLKDKFTRTDTEQTLEEF